MKPFKTYGSLALIASSFLVVTSCTKSLDEQAPKGDREVSTNSMANCDPFLGIQLKQTGAAGNFVFLGGFLNPIEKQMFNGSDFSANNLIQFSAGANAPFHDQQFMRIGVNDQWINDAEVLSLKIQNGKAAKRMHMQIRSMNAVGMAEFFLEGESVGSKSIIGGTEINGVVEYFASGDVKEFDEVQFSVTSGKLAITGFTPNLIGGGPSGFYLVEKPGDRLALRLKMGETNIGGMNYPNQFFTWTTKFVDGANADRQNRSTLPSMASGSGEFAVSHIPFIPVIPGSKHYVNIVGTVSGGVAPLVFSTETNAMRLGVGNQFLDAANEEINITPGPDFPTTMFRAVEVRVAGLNGAQLRVTAYDENNNLIATKFSSGMDKEWIQITSRQEFKRLVIRKLFGSGTSEPSIGRLTPGPVGGAILLYPGCN